MKRSEVQENLKWDLSMLLNGKTMQDNVNEVQAYIKTIIDLKGTIANSIDNLKLFLKTHENLSILLAKLNCFYENLENEDIGNQDVTKQKIQFMQFYQSVIVNLSFVDNELLDGAAKIRSYLETDNELKEYDFYFAKAFRYEEHRLSNEVDFAISNLSLPLSGMTDVFTKLTNADFIFAPVADKDGKMHDLTQGTYAKFASHEDIVLRENAYKSYWSTYFHHKFTLSSTYFFHLTAVSALAKLKNYQSSIHSILFHNFISVEFYQNLLKKVASKTHLIKDWKEILAKITQKNDPRPWDWNGPLFKSSNRNFSIIEAKEIAYKSLAPLGPVYKEKIDFIFGNRCIDWMPNDNKRSGAYSYAVWGGKPYIMLNWNGKYRDLSTLIHEMGHSVHTIFSSESQSFVYYNYPIILAEIASIFNEVLLYHHLVNDPNSDNELKKVVVEQLIKEFIGAVYRQAQFAEFEFLAHDRVDKRQPFDLRTLTTLCHELQTKYSPRLSTETYQDHLQDLWGLFVPHFYADFYVYQYVTGMIAAINLAENVFNNVPNAVDKYLTFLKAGCSKKPMDIIAEAGVDLNQPEAYDKAFDFFANLLSQLKTWI